jgi:hypothetical protein
MSRVGAAFLTALTLAATAPIPLAAAETTAAIPVAATEAPHRIARDAAWGCRDKNDVIDLLFQAISASFDGKLAAALADGRCVTFKPGEDVVIVEPGANGLVRVQRPGAPPVAYWTVSRNVK